MSVPLLPPRIGPSLRVRSLTIENFRVFGERVEIPLGDPLVTFHGRNGTGKSTAQIALMMAFHLLGNLRHRSAPPTSWAANIDGSLIQKMLSVRDQPNDPEHPLRIGVSFGHETLSGTFRFSFSARADAVLLEVSGDGIAASILDNQDRVNQVRTWVASPFGMGSRAFDVIGSRRQISWQQPQFTDVLLHATLAELLFELRTSRDPRDRESWRYFVEVLGRFDGFKGRVVSIDRITGGAVPQLTFEDRGRLILGLEELSSGEQQVVTLLAGVMLSRAAVLAIQEPEINLDGENQGILRGVLAELIDAGFKDQIIVESHVASFDGPDVVRFERDERGVTVGRIPSERGDSAVLMAARKSGALQHWVTQEGYTQLPDGMRRELGLTNGGNVWFVKGDRAWEAWREDQLASILGDTDGEGTSE